MTTPQVTASQSSASRGTGSKVSGVTRSHVIGSSVSGTQSTGTSGTGIGSWITSSQVTPSGDSDTLGIGSGSPGTGPQTVGTSSGRHLSDEDVEESLRQDASSKKRKPSWLKELVKEREEFVRPPRREVRESKATERFSSYMAQVTSLRDTVPDTYEEASAHQVWRDGMMEEYSSIMKNGVWEVVLRPEGKLVVTFKWLYKIKHAADRSIEKFKAHFVARGFSQVKGVDYDETFAPVARFSSIRALISIVAKMG